MRQKVSHPGRIDTSRIDTSRIDTSRIDTRYHSPIFDPTGA
jgi:hypothetical protein